MIGLLAIAQAVKAVVAGVPALKEVHLGLRESWPLSPAADVILMDARVRTLAAGNSDTLERVQLVILVYEALAQNIDADETALIPIADSLVETFTADAFDRTLSGLVEDCRLTDLVFGAMVKNNRNYRTCEITIFAGELDGDL